MPTWLGLTFSHFKSIFTTSSCPFPTANKCTVTDGLLTNIGGWQTGVRSSKELNLFQQGSDGIPATDPCWSPADICQDPIGYCSVWLYRCLSGRDWRPILKASLLQWCYLLCFSATAHESGVPAYRKNPQYLLSGIRPLAFAIQDKTPWEGIVLSTKRIAWRGGACYISLTGIRYLANLPC